jgi:hypothetical protein
MKIRYIIAVLFFCFYCEAIAQAKSDESMNENIPYKKIPDYPENYTSGTLIARMIDGLGYRYYWATEGLTAKDLAYLPGNEGRSSGDTMDHLLGLSEMIVNTIKHLPNIKPRKERVLDFSQKRTITLQNLKMASDILKSSTTSEIESSKIIFQRKGNSSEMPFWHLLNGPIADALTHVGQVVSYRRSSGNPINPNVNVFMGLTKE